MTIRAGTEMDELTACARCAGPVFGLLLLGMILAAVVLMSIAGRKPNGSY